MAKAIVAAAISHTNGNKGKGSHVTIRLNGLIMATATFGGHWSEINALKELAKAPQRFALAPKFSTLTPENIRSLVS